MLQGFDFTAHARCLCDDMVRRLPELRHIDLCRVAVGFSQTRKTAAGGLYASLTPMRFAGGRAETVRRGRKWRIQRLLDSFGREMLYVLNFYLPRFLDLPFRDKLTTVTHELWHIGPRFDGDLRRFRGRCYAHSGSQRRYDAQAARLVDQWLSLDPPESVYEFLRGTFQDLIRRCGRVVGQRVRAPRLIPL